MIGSALRKLVARALACLLAGLFICVVSYQSHAQDTVNKAIDELLRLEKRFEKPAEPEARPDPTIPESPDPFTADRIKFALSGIMVDGSTIYTDRELLPLYKDFLGTKVTLSQIFQITGRITVKYRADGYILSIAVVPAQRIKAGIVTIEVIEGFISGI